MELIGKKLKYGLLVLAWVACHCLFAQDDVNAVVHGVIKSEQDHQRLTGVIIKVYRNGNIEQNLRTDNLGKYQVTLQLGHSYEIRFEHPEYASKNIAVDTQGIPERARNTSFDIQFDGELFKAPPDFNKDVLKEPVARARFVDKSGKIELDQPHAEARKEEIKNEFERLKGDPTLMKQQYDALVKEGDALMDKKDWGGAADKYKAALKVRPHTDPAKTKYADAKAKYDAEQDAKNFEEKYARLVKEGDEAVASENWAEAKTKFTEASKMKPKETHPKEMLALCDKNLAGDKARAEYNRLIADADKKMAGKLYQLAIDQYNAASKQLPDESYPKEKMKECQDLLAEAMKNADVEKEYQRTKDDADLKMKAKKYEDAITLYEKAKTIKPKETYPDTQIALANNLIKERDYLILKKKYDEIIAKGDVKFNAKDYEGAIPVYEEARNILPSENAANEKIALANKAIAERDEAKKRKEYNELVAKADAQFNATDYENAIVNYESALKIYPTEAHPAARISESKKLLAEKLRKENKKAYQALIDKADDYYGAEKFEESISVYDEASKLMPDEKYPKERIEKAKAAIAKRDEKILQAKYDALVKQADTQFNSGEYEKSIETYTQALTILPSEKYPNEQIEKAYSKLDAARAEGLKREQYNQHLSNGDSRLADGQYEDAIASYKKALELFPKEQQPKDQIKKAESLIAEWKQKKADFDKMVAKADGKFKDEKWRESIDLYNQALAILPNEEYPKSRIIEATSKVDAAAAEALKKQQYDELIASADNKYKNRDYQMALDDYKKASDLYPDEIYPKERIDKCLIMLTTSTDVAVEENPKKKTTYEPKKYKTRELTRYEAYIMRQLARVEEKKSRDRDFHRQKTDVAKDKIGSKNVNIQQKKLAQPEPAEKNIDIVNEQTYKKGNCTITEITVRSGSNYNTYQKSVYSFATYYQEKNPDSGVKIRDMTAAEWKRVTGKEQ